jgi:hypothetical protein
MDLLGLQTQLGQLGVQPKDVYRAALYVDYLTHARTYFTTTLAGGGPGGLGVGYPFVAPALGSASLLQELADILDFYVAPAVDADLRRAYAPPPGGLGHGGPAGWTYQDYFTNVILDANAVTFGANLLAFRNRYPISAAALQLLSANFEGNVFLCCQRVIADEASLTAFYEDLYEEDFAILSLQKIKSTGSDFHKGGKQVLILTFQIVHTVDYGPPITFAPSREELKVVYKPSDPEADCLIVGDSAAVNNVIPGFMAASLFEIYNTRLQLMKTANPAFTGEPLTTYRILPRNYISIYAGAPPLPIRNAYGYIQYLDNDLSGTAPQVFGYYPFGASDYLIFTSQSKNDVTKSFYRQEGALAALCGSFSLIDMHIENLRVMKYHPYLIDLEISLTAVTNDISSTSLLGASGGITGISINNQEFSWAVNNAPGQAFIGRHYPTVYYQNRLWFAAANRQKSTIAVSRRYLLQGFTDGMSVLRTCEQNNDFVNWFARLNNVVVRYLPYATPQFKAIRTNIFINTLNGAAAGAALNPIQVARLRSFLSQEYDAFQQAANPAADPEFVSLTQPVCGPDYLNMDIPVFYHRIGTTGIVDSNGANVPIPPFVTVDAPGGGTRQARVLGVGGIFNRNTFFANQPMQTNVEQGQVQILAGGGFAARQTLLRGTITASLGNNATNPPSVIIGIND